MLRIKFIGKRDILNFYDLNDEHREEMKKSYANLLDDYEERSYFLNRFNEPELFEFMRINPSDPSSLFKRFHGHISKSYFSGALCILDDDSESFKLFDYCS